MQNVSANKISSCCRKLAAWLVFNIVLWTVINNKILCSFTDLIYLIYLFVVSITLMINTNQYISFVIFCKPRDLYEVNVSRLQELWDRFPVPKCTAPPFPLFLLSQKYHRNMTGREQTGNKHRIQAVYKGHVEQMCQHQKLSLLALIHA